jgi:hypothetical protein
MRLSSPFNEYSAPSSCERLDSFVPGTKTMFFLLPGFSSGKSVIESSLESDLIVANKSLVQSTILSTVASLLLFMMVPTAKGPVGFFCM